MNTTYATPAETLEALRDAVAPRRRTARAAEDKALGPRGCLARDLREARAYGRAFAENIHASWGDEPTWPTLARRWAAEGRECAAWWAAGGPYQGTPHRPLASLVRGTAAKWAVYARRLDALAATA